VPFVVLPATLARAAWVWRSTVDGDAVVPRGGAAPDRGLALCATVAAIGYLAIVHPSYAELFPTPNPEIRRRAELVAQHTDYADVVFSPDFAIPPNAPQGVALSMKEVHLIGSSGELADAIANLPPGARPVLAFLREPPESWHALLGHLRGRSGAAALYDVRRGSDR
jgi:hypothetical protein